MSDELDAVNKNLIQQIIKLRQAKAEIQETFNDLDELLNETSSFKTSFTSSLKTSKYKLKPNKSDLVISSTSYSSSDDDDFLINPVNDRSISSYSMSMVGSSDDSSTSNSDITTENLSNNNKQTKSRKSKTTPLHRSGPANIKFTVKAPIGSLSSYPYNPQPATFYYQSSLTDDGFSHVSKSDQVNKKRENANRSSSSRPEWIPNGKVQIPYKSYLSSSMSSVDVSRRSSTSASASTNQRPVKPWAHTGKIKPRAGIYLSSQDLRQSIENRRIYFFFK